jgi:hypothetical protein
MLFFYKKNKIKFVPFYFILFHLFYLFLILPSKILNANSPLEYRIIKLVVV